MRRTGSLPLLSARPGHQARGVIAATMLGLALAGCGGGLFDGTPYTGDVQPTVPKAETAEVAPLGPAEQPPVPSVGGPLGTAQAGPAKTYSIPSLEATDADRVAMQQARAQQQQAMQGQRQAQLNAQRQAAFQAQQQAQQQAAAQPQQQPTGTVAPLSFGQRRNTAAPAAMEAMPRPASPQTYPNLATVPQKPGDLPTPEQQAVVRNQLEADRAASGAPGALSFGNRAGGQAAAAPAAPAAAEPKPAFSFANRVVGTVKFDGGSTTMPAAGNSTVEQVAKTAQSPKLRVVGFGAGDGAGQAKARAEAVAAALRAAGVDPARIVTGGSADTRANITDDQAARVEIYLAQ